MTEKYDGRSFKATYGLRSILDFEGGYNGFVQAVAEKYGNGEEVIKRAEKSWVRALYRRVDICTMGFVAAADEMEIRRVKAEERVYAQASETADNSSVMGRSLPKTMSLGERVREAADEIKVLVRNTVGVGWNGLKMDVEAAARSVREFFKRSFQKRSVLA